MVTTGDIHKAEEKLKDAQTSLTTDESDLDDVMLAMDVVDTLRHEKLMVEKELFGEERRQALVVHDEDHIIWAVGAALAGPVRPSPETSRWLELSIQREG